MSGSPSPSKSVITTPRGSPLPVMFTVAANEPAPINPVLVFFKIEIVLPGHEEATISGRLSASKSPMAMFSGQGPTVKFTKGAKDPTVRVPGLLMLRETPMADPRLYPPISSGLLSPSKSAMVNPLLGPPISIRELNEAAVIEPGEPIFFQIEIEPPPALPTAMSVFPSPSKSAQLTLYGFDPAARSRRAPNEREPTVDVLRYMVIMLPP